MGGMGRWKGVLLCTGKPLVSFAMCSVNGTHFIFIYLTVQGLSCGMWDLASRPGIKPGPSALGAQSLRHWTTRGVATIFYNKFNFKYGNLKPMSLPL